MTLIAHFLIVPLLAQLVSTGTYSYFVLQKNQLGV